MSRRVSRIFALLAALALFAGSPAVCAGWAATPEARMACCVEGGGCGMHASEPPAGSDRLISQAAADGCCAASEGGDPGQPSPAFAASITPGVLGPASLAPVRLPALCLSDAWRTAAPVPAGPVPRHLLLSVFLV